MVQHGEIPIRIQPQLLDLGRGRVHGARAQIDALPVELADVQARERELDVLLAVRVVPAVVDVDLEDALDALALAQPAEDGEGFGAALGGAGLEGRDVDVFECVFEVDPAA